MGTWLDPKLDPAGDGRGLADAPEARRPRQNGLATALRELRRIERTPFTLEWLQNTELRRRVHVGLNKGEARNALARAIFFPRLNELRERAWRTSGTVHRGSTCRE